MEFFFYIMVALLGLLLIFQCILICDSKPGGCETMDNILHK
jgi:hypothetical protein